MLAEITVYGKKDGFKDDLRLDGFHGGIKKV